MVFSFFKKQSDKKMPERPAARPRPPEPPPEAIAPVAAPRTEDEKPASLPEPLPDLEFTNSFVKPPMPVETRGPVAPSASASRGQADLAFAIDDFDEADFTESSVMGIDVDQDIDPLQACVEQVVVMYANGQDAAARSLLETFVRAYTGSEGKRFWLLLFDLLQVSGDRVAYEKLGVEFAEACETSPPAWREEPASVAVESGPVASKVFLQGVVTSEGDLPIRELAKCVDQNQAVVVDCSKLIGCDDEIAGELAQLLARARKQRLALTLNGATTFMERLNDRLVVGEAKGEQAWRLLLELLQRFGTQDLFEERAVDYAITFELSPPSWEPDRSGPLKVVAQSPQPVDDAHFLSGELKGCRFEELVAIIDASPQPILDFSRVRRLDFVAAGQLVNRLAPFKAAGKDILIRSPNHLVAELMAVVGLNKLARIIVPKF